jgi:hypothetical protein
MLGRSLALLFALQLLAAACTGEPPQAASTAGQGSTAMAGSSAHPYGRNDDRDQDGLCDASEQRLGTDPSKFDTDADGFPDVVEVLSGYKPTDPVLPGPDQVGYLVAEPGRTLELELRSTIDGDGQGATGQFMARSAFDARGLSAGDFFMSGQAIAAEPPENVRGMQASEEHFASVLGRTRLTFRLHFQFDSTQTLDCAAALPFDYAIKSDISGYVSIRNYLLVLMPNGAGLEPKDFCRPVACL